MYMYVHTYCMILRTVFHRCIITVDNPTCVVTLRTQKLCIYLLKVMSMLYIANLLALVMTTCVSAFWHGIASQQSLPIGTTQISSPSLRLNMAEGTGEDRQQKAWRKTNGGGNSLSRPSKEKKAFTKNNQRNENRDADGGRREWQSGNAISQANNRPRGRRR